MKNIFWKASPFVMILTLALSGCPNPSDPGHTVDPVRTFTITFDGSGGTPELTTVEVAQGERFTPPESPTRSLWTFVGWFTHPTEGVAPFHFNTAIWADITLYARWSKNPIPVTFALRGGEWALENNIVYAAPGNAVARPINDPTKEFHTFAGWFAHPTAAGTAWDFDTPITQPTTIHARWDAYVRVTFDLQGGEWDLENYVYIALRTTLQRPANNPARELYNFTNWYAEPEGITVWSFAAPIAGAVTIYAGWADTRHTVTFDARGGTPAPSEQRIRSGQPASEPVGVTRTNQPYDQGLFASPAAWDNWTVHWYHGNERWDFSDPVTQNMHLIGRWSTPYGPIDVSGQWGTNIVHQGFDYVLHNPGDYYLILAQNITLTPAWTGPGTTNTGIGDRLTNNSRLTLIGVGEERFIRRDSANPARYGSLFRIDDGSELVLGNNITLSTTAPNIGMNPLVIVWASASFTMLPGSRITGHRMTANTPAAANIDGNAGAAVMLLNDATFTMKGGEISGNSSVSAWPNGATALQAFPGATVNLQGGRIFNNRTDPDGRMTALNGIALSMFSNLYTPINFTVSGNAEIEDVVISRFGDGPAMATKNTITIDEGWTGSINRLNLHSSVVPTFQAGIDLWEDEYVLSPVTGQSLTAALVNRVTTGSFFVTAAGVNLAPQLIANTHEIADDGKLVDIGGNGGGRSFTATPSTGMGGFGVLAPQNAPAAILPVAGKRRLQ